MPSIISPYWHFGCSTGTVMARPIWKGAISFGLVTIPVGLYSALERQQRLSFHLLHDKDGSRIDYRRFCAAESVEVPWSEIVRGYEYDKGQYVVLTDADFAKAKVAATEMFEIREFVPAGTIEPVYFEQPYYLAPAGKTGTKAYALLRDALERNSKIGIGTIVLRQREHLAALAPVDEALVLTTMRFAYEIRSPRSLDLPKAGFGWEKREMELALQLIDTLAADWDPTRYRDQYQDVLKKVIEQKASGREIRLPVPPRPAKVIDLMSALQASVERHPKRDTSRRSAGRVRTGARRPTRKRRRAA
jgi:DNA end-binding protein Ku